MQISLSEASAERRIREFWGWALRDLAEKPALMRYEPARASPAASALLRGPRDDALVLCKHHPPRVHVLFKAGARDENNAGGCQELFRRVRRHANVPRLMRGRCARQREREESSSHTMNAGFAGCLEASMERRMRGLWRASCPRATCTDG